MQGLRGERRERGEEEEGEVEEEEEDGRGSEEEEHKDGDCAKMTAALFSYDKQKNSVLNSVCDLHNF